MRENCFVTNMTIIYDNIARRFYIKILHRKHDFWSWTNSTSYIQLDTTRRFVQQLKPVVSLQLRAQQITFVKFVCLVSS